MTDRLLTTEEVAALLRVPKCTVYSMIHKHRIPVLRLSRKKVLFSEQAIMAWLQSKTQDVSQQPITMQPSRRGRHRKNSAIAENSYVTSLVEQAKKEVIGDGQKNKANA